MADIELVIKIPEEDFERCKKRFQMRINTMGDAIANGTLLPKGHGDLIERSNLLTVTDYDGENEKVYVLYDEIDNAPTIIKADKEVEE